MMIAEGAEETVEIIVRHCRFCRSNLKNTFIDLGLSPLANSYIKAGELNSPEIFYPLHAYVCSECFLVQLEEFSRPEEIFSDYIYFSSYSDSWLEHASIFARQAVKRFNLDKRNSLIVEIGSNDGYLLRFFIEAGFRVLGIEPSEKAAAAAWKVGVKTLTCFFNSKLAEKLVSEGKNADLLVVNNVLAHVPDTNDLMIGMKKLLNSGGVVSMEFPHLLSLVDKNQFDTIYHEHYSYFSLTTLEAILSKHGLFLFDLERLNTHGGSLRIYAGHEENMNLNRTRAVDIILEDEERRGIKKLSFYDEFSFKVKDLKRRILKSLIEIKEQGRTIVGYGAPAKGNTLLNYLGIGTDFIDYTVDRNPHKQGLFLPGSRIPILEPATVFKTKPDYLLILPWNLRDEIKTQMSGINQWGGRFITLIPDIKYF